MEMVNGGMGTLKWGLKVGSVVCARIRFPSMVVADAADPDNFLREIRVAHSSEKTSPGHIGSPAKEAEDIRLCGRRATLVVRAWRNPGPVGEHNLFLKNADSSTEETGLWEKGDRN